MRRKVLFVTLVMLIVLLTGCGNRKLSGKYSSEDGVYSVEFLSDSECTWYQDDSFFNGTYKNSDNSYQLEIIGDGFYSNTVFTAEIDGEDLIITGGNVNQVRFIKN